MTIREMKQHARQRFQVQYPVAVLGTLIVTGLLGVITGVTWGILVIFVMPILVGEAKLFMKLHIEDKTDLMVVFDGFKPDNYIRNLLQLFLRNIFIFLWTLLFIIPGIIKHYAYALVPFLLADDESDLSETDAITESRRLMNGHKMELFIIDLSFLGWLILSALTFGILYVLYVGPYYMQTKAIFYRKVQDLKA